MPRLYFCNITHNTSCPTAYFDETVHTVNYMESVLHIVSPHSVLLLNGSFVQSAAAVRYEQNEPLFVTVLPLDATFLSYTVELLGGKAVCNQSLVTCCDMGGGHHYIELKPRSAFVYAPGIPPVVESSVSVPAQLLRFVRDGNFDAARSMMTQSLRDSLSDEALSDFFDGVFAVRENVYTPQKGYLLLKTDGTATQCVFEMHGGLIENVTM